MRNLWKCLFVCFGAAGCCALPGADLVRDGKAQAVIVLDSSAGAVEKHAARELSVFVEKITGARLPVAEKASPGKIAVRIGKTGAGNPPPEWKTLAGRIRVDGFGVAAGKDGVFLFANVGRGLLYGVYHVLRKYGGVYFLYPGEEGEVVPKRPDFSIPDGSEVRNPVFSYRKFHLNGGSGWTPETYDWLLRNGLVLYSGPVNFSPSNRHCAFLEERGTVFQEGGHTMGVMLIGSTKSNREYREKTASLLKEHPEYFGLVNGKRLPAGNYAGCCQPCTSNPEVLKRMLAYCLERSRIYGGREHHRNFCNDDHTVWCQCEACRKLDSPLETNSMNRRSTRWWHFINHMAHEILDSGKFPNTTVTTLAYQNFRMPPLGIKPDPRVLVGLAPHQRCYIHPLTDPACPINADKFRGMFEAWHKAGMRLFTFEYHPEMPGATNYLFNEKTWVEDLRFYRRLGMAGYGMVTNAPNAPYNHYRKNPQRQYQCRNRWMSSWQRHWMTGYFSWNIDADYDTVSEKINSLYYGPAWKVMREYRKLLTDAVQDSRLHMGYGTPNSVLGKCYDRPGIPQNAMRLLAEAEKAAGSDPVILRRIALDREYFKANWEAAHREYLATRQKEYNVRRRTGAISIDGKLDEADWKDAEFCSDFKVFIKGNPTDVKADPETFVRMLYDDSSLYFAVEAMKARNGRVNAEAKSDGISALNGSHIEIFLTPPERKGYYYHLGFSVNGYLYQALTTSGSSRDETVRLNPEYKVRDLPDRWILEARVPVGPLKVKLRDGLVWRINVGRFALADSGRMQGSSWSAGVFHGSDVHRTVAFGKQGAILRNGDLEDLTGPKIRKKRNPAKKEWVYGSGSVPNFWFFNENNTGSVEMRNDSPASGKQYMRVSGLNAFIGQVLTLPAKMPGRFRITARVRGRGEALLLLYRNGRYFRGDQKRKSFDSPGAWITLSNEIECPEGKNLTFYMRITGTVDIDDIRILPVDGEEEMPNAMKHT